MTCSKLCQNCRTRRANRPRGLCWPCYHRPGVREQYPTAATYSARRGTGLGNRALPLPPRPTVNAPGSPGKQSVMAWRAANGYQIFHPDDAVTHAD